MRSVLVALVALGASSAAAAHALEPTTLRLTAESQAHVAPDQAVIQAGVSNEASTAAQAMAANARQMNEVIRAVRRSGVSERDTQTSTISLEPQYAYVEGQPPRLTGYRAANLLEVTVRDVKNLGKILDAAASAGTNRIDGVRFESSNSREALNAARLQAVQEARARADMYAQAVGLKVVRVALIEEGEFGSPPQPLPVVRLAKADFATPVEPGEISLSVAIVATFELQ